MFDEKTIAEFKKPLTAHQMAGTRYKYAKISEVIDKLNVAFDYSWSSNIVDIHQQDRFVLCHVILTVLDADKVPVSKHGVGGSEMKFKRDKPTEVVDLAKDYASAFASALKQAAKQFGIRVGEDEAKPSYGQNKGNYNRTSRPAQPVRPPMKPTPAPLPTKSARKISSSELVEQTMRNMNKPKSSSVVVQSKPPVQKPATVSNVVTPSGEISEYQEKALRAIAERIGMSPAELIKKSIDNSNKTAFVELTKREASAVINYGNTIVWKNEDSE